MKNLHPALKYLLLIIINTCPFVLSVILYRIGATEEIFFVFIINRLILLNYKSIDNPLPFILLQIYMLACEILSEWLETYLYYHNVSNDGETLAIGQSTAIIFSLMILLATIILGISKIRSYHKQCAEAQQEKA